jgi:asparagine synthase (glutamine-hydrolysing)
LTDPPDASEFVDRVVDEHYSLWGFDDDAYREAFADRVRADAAVDADALGRDALPAYEEWEWTTRMTTFTNADARLYDWFDVDWWLPLWDPAYVRFWASVPAELRLDKHLQSVYTARTFRRVADVDALAARWDVPPAAAARYTDADWTPVDQLRRTVETRPRAAVDADFETLLGAQAVPPSAVESWGNYPLGWYGVIPRADAETFDAAPTLYSLRALEALDALSFDPPRVPDGSLSETLSLPPTDASRDEHE